MSQGNCIGRFTAGEMHRSFVESRPLRVRLRFLRMTAQGGRTNASVPTWAGMVQAITRAPRAARDDKLARHDILIDHANSRPSGS
jgi:hypothetical protein